MRKNFRSELKRMLPGFLIRWRMTFLSFFAWAKANIYPKPKKFGYFGKNVDLRLPLKIWETDSVYLHDNTRLNNAFELQSTNRFMGKGKGRFIVKKFSACRNVTVVTFNHKPTVGVPYILTPEMGMDEASDIIIEEDVWVGINVTLLAGAHIGRGAVVAACSLVNREVPPYAVVAGFPAKIVASKFSLDEILEHERILYPPDERFSRDFLEDLFENYFRGMKSIGRADLSPEQQEILKKLKKERDIAIYS